MSKPDPRGVRRTPDDQSPATQREPREPDESEAAALEREIERIRRESEAALAAYKRAFEAPAPRTRPTTARRFP